MRKRTRSFSSRLSNEEYENLNRAIAKCNMTKSAFMRMIAKHYLPKERPPDGYDEIMSELAEIGNNLYHIANTSNTDMKKVSEQAKRLDDVILKINEIFTVPEKMRLGDEKWLQQKFGI